MGSQQKIVLDRNDHHHFQQQQQQHQHRPQLYIASQQPHQSDGSNNMMQIPVQLVQHVVPPPKYALAKPCQAPQAPPKYSLAPSSSSSSSHQHSQPQHRIASTVLSDEMIESLIGDDYDARATSAKDDTGNNKDDSGRTKSGST